MPVVDINYVAVIIAAAANMVLGAVWYSPVLFAKQWMELTGRKDMNPAEGATVGYIIAAAASLVSAYVLAHFVVYTNAKDWMGGAVTGFWVWLGFVLTSHATHYMFEGRRKQLLAINVGYTLVGLVVMGAILAYWK